MVVLSEDHRICADGTPAEVLAQRDLLLEVNLIHEHAHRHRGLHTSTRTGTGTSTGPSSPSRRHAQRSTRPWKCGCSGRIPP